MAEDFNISTDLIIPGTYIRVLSEGLIGAAGFATGNVGIVGSGGPDAVKGKVQLLSSAQDATAIYGQPGADKNLPYALGLLYGSGAGIVYALGMADGNWNNGFAELLKYDVNILVAPERTTSDAAAMFGTVLDNAQKAHKDMMAVIGLDSAIEADLTKLGTANVPADGRIVVVTPGVTIPGPGNTAVPITDGFSALPVAALLSTLTPQTSPTNKVVPGISGVTTRYSYGQIQQLLGSNLMVLEDRRGVRVVRGITTDPGAFRQVTTRRIVNAAKAGIRLAADPFIGRLNNVRVRAALRGAIDGFLASMVQDEALVGYKLDVTATRQDEINNRAIVTANLLPTFSIDYIAVTMILQ